MSRNLAIALLANNWNENLHPRLGKGTFAPKMGQTQPSKDPKHMSSQDKKTHPNFEKTMGGIVQDNPVKMPRISKYTFGVAEPQELNTKQADASTESTEQDANDTSDFIIESPYLKIIADNKTASQSVEQLMSDMMECGSEHAWHKKLTEAGISTTALAILKDAGVKIKVEDWYKNSGEYDYGSNTITLRKSNQKAMSCRFIDEGTHALCRFLFGESGFPQAGRSSFSTWNWTVTSDIKKFVAQEFSNCYDIENVIHAEDIDGNAYDTYKPRFDGIDEYGGKICHHGHEFLTTISLLLFNKALGKNIEKQYEVYEAHAPNTLKLVESIWFNSVVAENMALSSEGWGTVEAIILAEGNILYEKETELTGTDEIKYDTAYLPKEELNEAALNTLEGVPVVTKTHAWRSTGNFRDMFTVGWVVGKPSITYTPSGRCGILCKLRIMDQQAMNELKSGERRMVSAGYKYFKELEPGTSPYGDYDFKQKNLRFNHVLIVPSGQRGRCGPEVSIIN